MINENSQRLIEEAKAVLHALLNDEELKGVLGLAIAGVRDVVERLNAETDIADAIETLTECCELLMLAGSSYSVTDYEIKTASFHNSKEANRRLRRGATMDLCAIVRRMEGENVLTK